MSEVVFDVRDLSVDPEGTGEALQVVVTNGGTGPQGPQGEPGPPGADGAPGSGEPCT